jgi:hypothetical protein
MDKLTIDTVEIGLPRTACGQYVTLFMKGYTTTTPSDDAPNAMLMQWCFELNFLVATCSYSPVPIHLKKDGKACSELQCQETDRLRWRNLMACQRTSFSSG